MSAAPLPPMLSQVPPTSSPLPSNPVTVLPVTGASPNNGEVHYPQVRPKKQQPTRASSANPSDPSASTVRQSTKSSAIVEETEELTCAQPVIPASMIDHDDDDNVDENGVALAIPRAPTPPRRTKRVRIVEQNPQSDSDGDALVAPSVSQLPVAKRTSASKAAKNEQASPPPQVVEQHPPISRIAAAPATFQQTLQSVGNVEGQGIHIFTDPTKTVYGPSDIRNPAVVEGLFRQSLSALQNAPLERSYHPDCEAYMKEIRIRPTHLKVTVEKMMANSDGETKWNALAYGSVKLGAGVGVYGQIAPKLDQTGYFVGKNWQDLPETYNPDGTLRTYAVSLPQEMFKYELTGPSAPQVSVSTKAGGKKSAAKKE